ncbi:hypothetical protein SNE40_001142 [Patella caerulea]|uniref:Eukaryotic translation initiation factor 3 subunit D n=1 Tax=Patella caerulea TaxID=87958 RepID=A0AAN8KGS7_PATCE
MAHFNPPKIQENPNGWGPCSIPEQFKDMPYQPFSKDVRLGKVSDWTGATYQDKRYLGKYYSAYGGGQQYAYYHDEDESSFHLVDTAKIPKPLYQRGRRMFQQSKQRKERERKQAATQAQLRSMSKTMKNRERDRQRLLKKWQKQFGKQQMENRHKAAPAKSRDSSVQVEKEWDVVEEMDFPRLTKLSLPNVDPPVDLVTCGAMEFYEKSYDRVTTKSEKRLKRVNRIFHKVTTTDDPIIRQLVKGKANVFATDAILATLMCCTRSVYSWDILVQRVGNKLFFDKRDTSEFNLLTVSETATEPPQDEAVSFNSPHNLALEATFINHNFSQQVLRQGEETYDFEKPNPFIQNEEASTVASVGYRYRKWKLGNDIELVARCEHDAVMHGPNGELQFINIKALNEWDSRSSGGVEWRSRLDNQRGAVLATELKNNSCKMAKWTVGALLAGSDQIKLGYVSRVHVKDSSKHVILGTQQFKPIEFASQMNLNMENAWGVLRCIIDTCLRLKEGKYLIMKDPNRPVIRIYDIPDNTFESDDEESGSDEDSDFDEDDENADN